MNIAQFFPLNGGNTSPEITISCQQQLEMQYQRAGNQGISFPGRQTVTRNMIPSFSSEAKLVNEETRPGTALTGKSCVYERSLVNEGESLNVFPITIYKSERVPGEYGETISVNGQYISYPIRNGLIRLINRTSVLRMLIRDHEHHRVKELAFFNTCTNLLLSSATDDKIIIWKLYEAQEDDSDQFVIKYDIEKVVHSQSQRVKWHPIDNNKIVIANDNIVTVVDLSTSGTDPIDNDSLEDISVLCVGHTDKVNDVCFSPDGNTLVSSSKDGNVRIWDVSQSKFPGKSDCLRIFEPFNGMAVSSILFLARDSSSAAELDLIIGGEDNSVISLWSAPLGENAEACHQVLMLRSDLQQEKTVGIHDLSFRLDPTGDFLFIADRNYPNLYVVHFSRMEINTGLGVHTVMDNITEFFLAYPILSMTVTSMKHHEEHEQRHERDLMLYCIQTAAIQQYYIPALKCYAPSSVEQASEISTTTSPVSILHSSSPSTSSPSSTHSALPSSMPFAIRINPNVTIPEERGNDINLIQSVGALTTEDDTINHNREQSASERPDPSLSSWANNEPEIESHRGGGGTYNNFLEDSDIELNTNTGISTTTTTTITSPNSISKSQSNHDNINLVLRKQEKILSELNQLYCTVKEDKEKNSSKSIACDINEFLNKNLQTIIHKDIQQSIPTISRMLVHTVEKNLLKPIQNSLNTILLERIVPNLEAHLVDFIETKLPKPLNNSLETMVQNVSQQVRQPVRESFRECFQDVIIPSFQAATQKMFEQINDTFVKGIGSQAYQAENNGQIAHIQSQIDDLTKSVKELAIIVKKSHGNKERVQQQSNSFTRQEEMNDELNPTVPIQTENILSVITRLIAVKEYDQAFQKALSAQQIELVVAACQLSKTQDVLSIPSKLSQMVLLCLIQQLASDLQSDLDLKFEWLKSALLVLDPEDVSIQMYVKNVLLELQKNLDGVSLDLRTTHYRILQHIVASVLTNASIL